MNPYTAVMLFAIIWWVVLLAVLPWGVRPPENPEPGHAPSAPERPMMGRKVLATTVITAVIWGILFYLISNDILVFRDL
jgi:predicted secreted protein